MHIWIRELAYAPFTKTNQKYAVNGTAHREASERASKSVTTVGCFYPQRETPNIPKSTAMNIKIYGLPRTGTTATEIILSTNFLCQVLVNLPQGVGKHIENPIIDRKFACRYKHVDRVFDDIRFAICVRDPVQWLLGFHRWCNDPYYYLDGRQPKIPPMPLHKFVRMGNRVYRDEKPADSWNKLYSSWLSISNNPKISQIIRQEDLYRRQEAVMDRVAENFDLTLKEPQFIPVKRRVNPNRKCSDYYKPIATEIPEDLKIEFLSALDKDITKALGYEITDDCRSTIQTEFDYSG